MINSVFIFDQSIPISGGQTMATKLQVYKCEMCGSIVEVMHAGAGMLACCNQSMALLTENTTDAAQEKHVPVIEKVAGGFKVTVGSVAHPMQDEHYIEWIELLADGKSYTQFLNPGDEPTATFQVEASSVTAREYCNLHGHWAAKGSQSAAVAYSDRRFHLVLLP
jgi:superoxide reductase